MFRFVNETWYFTKKMSFDINTSSTRHFFQQSVLTPSGIFVVLLVYSSGYSYFLFVLPGSVYRFSMKTYIPRRHADISVGHQVATGAGVILFPPVLNDNIIIPILIKNQPWPIPRQIRILKKKNLNQCNIYIYYIVCTIMCTYMRTIKNPSRPVKMYPRHTQSICIGWDLSIYFSTDNRSHATSLPSNLRARLILIICPSDALASFERRACMHIVKVRPRNLLRFPAVNISTLRRWRHVRPSSFSNLSSTIV